MGGGGGGNGEVAHGCEDKDPRQSLLLEENINEGEDGTTIKNIGSNIDGTDENTPVEYVGAQKVESMS